MTTMRSQTSLKKLLEDSLKRASPITGRIYKPSNRMTEKGIITHFKKVKVANIATTKPSGAPHVVPVSFIYLDEKIYVNTNKKSTRYENHLSDDRVALSIPRGYDSVLVEGKAKIAGRTIDFIDGEVGKTFRLKYDRERRRNPDAVMIEIVPDKILSFRRRRRRRQ